MKMLVRAGWRIAIIAGAVFPALATFAQNTEHAAVSAVRPMVERLKI